uniref:Uncharacterized protein n=1 Tax=Hyaloperonospora arabidopsidis (strain Emoy2) TaxID=559515 RepID=M4BIC0_HYAAE
MSGTSSSQACRRRARSKAQQFRHTPLANLEDSERLFQGSFATESYASSGRRRSTASKAAGGTRSPSPDGLDDGSPSKTPLRREPESAETPLRSRNNETPSVSRHSQMPARLEDGHPRNEVQLPSVLRHRKRSKTNGAVSLADALDRVTAVMSAPPALSVQMPAVQQVTEILVAMKNSGHLEPSEVVALVSKLIENEKLAEAFLAYDDACRKFWVDSELKRD